MTPSNNFLSARIAFNCSILFSVNQSGLNIFDSLDFVTANILLPLGGLLTSIFAGWVLDRKILHAEVSEHGSMKCRLFGLLVMLLRYVCPALLLWIFLKTHYLTMKCLNNLVFQ